MLSLRSFYQFGSGSFFIFATLESLVGKMGEVRKRLGKKPLMADLKRVDAAPMQEAALAELESFFEERLTGF